MSVLPESLLTEPSSVEGSRICAGGEETGGATTSEAKICETPDDLSELSVEQLIVALNDDQNRKRALELLSQNIVSPLQKRSMCDNLGILLWHSFGTIFTLLKEIMEVYYLLSKPELTDKASDRACNALVLLQCVASHPETKMSFVKANIPIYLYPFLDTTNKDMPHEFLRLTSLGVIGALVKVDDKKVINFLLKTEIISYCLRCMDIGNEFSKTVATFIVQKILLNDNGFRYCCIVADRFFAITHTLATMTEQETSHRLLKHIIRCYLRLSECPRACLGLKRFLPRRLNDAAIMHLFRDDPITMSWLQELHHNVYERTIRAYGHEHGDLTAA